MLVVVGRCWWLGAGGGAGFCVLVPLLVVVGCWCSGWVGAGERVGGCWWLDSGGGAGVWVLVLVVGCSGAGGWYWCWC